MRPQRRTRIPSRACVVAFALALLAASFILGCARQVDNEQPRPTRTAVAQEEPPAVDPEAPPVVSPYYASPLGAAGLNQRVFNAAVIARVKLKSTQASAEFAFTRDDGSKRYQGLVHFTFEALAYLKGSGGNELVAVATVGTRSDVIQHIMDSTAKGEFIDWNFIDDENPYTSMELALEAANKWKDDRVTTWDDREAIIMVEEQFAAGSMRYWLGAIWDFALGTTYVVWLPATTSVGAQSAGQSQSDMRYLLEPPARGSTVVPAGAASAESTASPTQAATISVLELKAVVAKMAQWRKDSEGIEDYERCIRESFGDERYVNGMKEQGLSTYMRFDYTIESGLTTGFIVQQSHGIAGKMWLEGDDKELFEIAPHDNGILQTKRPLPAGEYSVYRNYQADMFIPCNYLPDDAQNTLEQAVTVTKAAGAKHEAFFDPVAISTAVGADATNGALKPASFAIDDDTETTTTLDSIAWESRRVTIEVSPNAVPANHHVDFIGLDGKFALRLDVDDATKSVDGDDITLTWGVCKQPWKAGDQLMLRISESDESFTGATNDAACDGTPIPTLTPRPN